MTSDGYFRTIVSILNHFPLSFFVLFPQKDQISDKHYIQRDIFLGFYSILRLKYSPLPPKNAGRYAT